MDYKMNEFKALIEHLWMAQKEGETTTFHKDEYSWFEIEFDYDEEGCLALMVSEFEAIPSNGTSTKKFLGGALLTGENIETPEILDRICEDILIRGIHHN